MRKKIAVDVDEVLAASAKSFVKFSNDRWGTNLTIDDYDEHWARMWNITDEETHQRWLIYHDERIIRDYEPFADAVQVLHDLSKRFKLFVATSRSETLSGDTKIWIDKHYPGIFANIYHSGIYDKGAADVHSLTKADMLLDLNADYLIDDQPKHCLGAADAGLKAVLFGDYAWSRNIDLPAGVTRCKDWRAVQEYFAHERSEA